MSETTSPRLETAIRAVLAPVLKEDGFSGSGRTFRRVSSSWVQVLNVQGARDGGAFAINLAIHPLAIPDVQGNTPDPKKITEELCEFRRRLSETGTDQWWKHELTEESMLLAVQEAVVVYRRRGNELLQRASGPNSGFNAVLAADFSAGAYDSAGFGSTEVRLALALARLRKSENKAEEARAFAAHGLVHVGRATLLRRELEALAA
ncbi:DUF4304 domain-containing protein [Acidovorax sp. LjRoot66]|uniref:DUF4304 domain-containing protein n=1 Tax=Acidovorax sp. LjRoot66 TaxID=3342334 RepID=UPI003ED11C3F